MAYSFNLYGEPLLQLLADTAWRPRTRAALISSPCLTTTSSSLPSASGTSHSCSLQPACLRQWPPVAFRGCGTVLRGLTAAPQVRAWRDLDTHCRGAGGLRHHSARCVGGSFRSPERKSERKSKIPAAPPLHSRFIPARTAPRQATSTARATHSPATSRRCAPPETPHQHTSAWVFCMSRCADVAFRGTRSRVRTARRPTAWPPSWPG